MIPTAELEEKIKRFPCRYHGIELPGGVVPPGFAPISKESHDVPKDL